MNGCRDIYFPTYLEFITGLWKGKEQFANSLDREQLRNRFIQLISELRKINCPFQTCNIWYVGGIYMLYKAKGVIDFNSEENQPLSLFQLAMFSVKNALPSVDFKFTETCKLLPLPESLKKILCQ